MLTLIQNGGVPMVFILLVGCIGLGSSFYLALRADRRSLGFVQGMMQALLFATLAALAADVGATLYAVSRAMDDTARAPQAVAMLVQGLAESTSPAIMGFSFLAVTALLTAVGRRRIEER